MALWTITKSFRFEASHLLENHDGLCAKLHGHSWVAEIEFRGDKLYQTGPKTGMLIDYATITEAMDPLLKGYLDHRHLNDSLKIYPTSENVAQWIFDRLTLIPGIFVKAVTIHETCTSKARYES